MSIITSLSRSRIRHNKSRSLLTAIAIMLTTILLTGLGTSVIGIIDMERQQASALSNIHASFNNLTSDQVNMLKNHIDVEAVKINEIFADIEYGKMNGLLTYSKDIRSGIYQKFGTLTEGRYAENPDEICGPPVFFERLGTDAIIGNKVTIQFRPYGAGVIQTREFTICGLVSERDISDLDINDSRIAYSAMISEALVNEYIQDSDRRYSAQIRVNGENKLSYDEIKSKIENIAHDIGCNEDNITFNSEYLYTMTEPASDSKGIIAVIALLIVIFSGVVIYSIYYVGVITDVQEIGKLKALGASKKQIKRMLLSKGIQISLYSIPSGLIIGYAIPYFLLPLVMNRATQISLYGIEIEKINMFSIPVIILCAVAVLLTVCISLLKPMKMAANIPPIEAIRYQESSNCKKCRKGNINITLSRLSFANLSRNKRRTIITIFTMGLSCVLFMSLAGVMNSMSAEDIARRNIKTGEFRIELDAEWNDKEYPENNLDNLQKQNIFSNEFIDKIQNIDGVESVTRSKAVLAGSDEPLNVFEDGKRKDLSYITREDAQSIKKDIKRGELDYDTMLAENGAVFSSDMSMDEYGIEIGDTIPLIIYDGERKIGLNIKITASADLSGSCFLIPAEIYDALGLTYDSTTDIYISVDKSKYESVKNILQEITNSSEHLKLYSMDEELKIGGMSVNIIKYPVYVILIMIAVISFMNLINTMIISIVTRKRELGVLQAIGLSDKQMIKMLLSEGMVFTAGTLLLSVTVGNIFGYILFLIAKQHHIMSISVYHYPVIETVSLASILIIGQLFIIYIINKRVHKGSLIDRIRSSE